MRIAGSCFCSPCALLVLIGFQGSVFAGRDVAAAVSGDDWCELFCASKNASSPRGANASQSTGNGDSYESDGCACRCSSQGDGRATEQAKHSQGDGRATEQARATEQEGSGAPESSVSGHSESTERAIAGMVLGSVAFHVSLFYIVNNPDVDIARVSVCVIGQTISIFCSVLAFEACFKAVEGYFEHSGRMETLAPPCFSVALFLVMEWTLMVTARVRGERARQTITVAHTKSLSSDLGIMAYELDAKVVGAGTAQMCAAATMRGFGHLQFLASESAHRTSLVWAVCPAVFAALFVVAWLVAHARAWRIRYDNVIEDSEIVWIRVAEDSENEVIALACGFLCAVAFRVSATESFPEMVLDGFRHRESLEVVSARELVVLWIGGILSGVACIALNIFFFGLLEDGINEDKLRTDSAGRIVRMIIETFGMTFAWCTCFGSHQLAVNFRFAPEGLQLRLVVAILQSIAAYMVIVLLSRISAEITGAAFHKALSRFTAALGASVGFAWEHAFEVCAGTAVDFMAENRSFVFGASNNTHVWALVLSGTIVLAVAPAYRWYIVPRMYHMMEEHELDLMKKERDYRIRASTSEHESVQWQSGKTFFWFGGDSQLETVEAGHME